MTLPAAAMIAIAIPGSALALVVARLGNGDACLEAGFQRSCTTAVECLCQVGAHILSGQFTTGTGFIMACQVLRVGQQHLDFAIPIDAAGRNGCPAGCGTLKCSLVECTNSLDGIASAVCAQCKLYCQLLRLGQSRTGSTVTGGILVAIALMAHSIWHSGGGLRARDGGNHPLTGRGGGKDRRRASEECDSDKHSDQEFSFEHVNELHTNLFFQFAYLQMAAPGGVPARQDVGNEGTPRYAPLSWGELRDPPHWLRLPVFLLILAFAPRQKGYVDCLFAHP